MPTALPGHVLAASADGARTDGDADGDADGDVPAYRMDEDAKKIKGTAGSGDGPEIEPGTYADSIGRGEKRYYRVDLDAKSSAFISAVAAPVPGSRVKDISEGLKIALENVDGSACNGGTQPRFNVEGEAYPIADYATRIMGANDQCQQAGPYLFSVEREGSATSDPARWPLEIRFMSEPGLKGGPSARPTDAPLEAPGTDEETPAPFTGGERKQAHGGSGFNDAGALSKGVWKDRIHPGETRFYRVPVDWGQRLNATVELGSASSPGEFPPTIYDGLGVTVYNPARGQFDDDPFLLYTPDKSAQAAVYTPSVDYARRFGYSKNTPCVAGWHYLAVTVSPKLSKYFKPTAPLTLRVDVTGKVKAGPAYAGDAHAAGFGVSDDDKEQAETGRSAADVRRGDTLRLVAYAGIGAGVVLILVLVVWTLLARRRVPVPGALPVPGGPSATVPLRAQRAPAQPNGQPYGQQQGEQQGQQPPPQQRQ